jgi:hypothetical protein
MIQKNQSTIQNDIEAIHNSKHKTDTAKEKAKMQILFPKRLAHTGNHTVPTTDLVKSEVSDQFS